MKNTINTTIITFVLVFFGSCTQRDTKKINKVNESKILVDSAINIAIDQGDNPDIRSKQLMLLDSAIKLDSNNKSAYNNKIGVLFTMHRFKDVINTINQFDPQDKLSHLLMLKGFIYEKQYKDTLKSKVYYNKALQILDSLCLANQNNEGYAITRAFTILFVRGKPEGIKAYNALIDKYPDDKSLLRMKSQFYDFDKEEYLKTIWSAK